MRIYCVVFSHHYIFRNTVLTLTITQEYLRKISNLYENVLTIFPEPLSLTPRYNINIYTSTVDTGRFIQQTSPHYLWSTENCRIIMNILDFHNLTLWLEFASELYRPNDRRLSAKLMPTFADRGCHVVNVTDAYGSILEFLDRHERFYIANYHLYRIDKTKTKLHGLSPRANYTDRATAACRRSNCQLLRIEVATWSAW
jgi:hypothetical protein